MAVKTDLNLFIGTDFFIVYTILNAAETLAQDVTGWSLSWMMKTDPSEDDADALITKTTADSEIAIAGTFSSVIASNTQTAAVTIEDTDTDTLTPGTYYCELKRITVGNETILAYGQLKLVRGVHH